MKKIYTLQLLNNKYYIGIISNLDRQIGEYFDGYGSQWIKLNNPIKINNLDEDKYVKIRYNSFIKINLNNIKKIIIKDVLFAKKN
jgi:predicted GIY-YIG superfamily endonuclease